MQSKRNIRQNSPNQSPIFKTFLLSKLVVPKEYQIKYLQGDLDDPKVVWSELAVFDKMQAYQRKQVKQQQLDLVRQQEEQALQKLQQAEEINSKKKPSKK